MRGLFEFIFEKPELLLKDELKRSLLFQGLSSKELDIIIKKTGIRHFSKGQHVFFESDPGAALYLIVNGSVRIVRQKDGQNLPIATLSKGMFFGELAIFEPLPRTAGALALEDSTLLFLFKHDVEEIVLHHAKLGTKLLWNIGSILAQRLRAMNETAKEPK